MIILNKDDFREKLCHHIINLQNPSKIKEIKHISIFYVRSIFYHRPWFGLFSLPIGLILEKKVDLMDKKSFFVRSIFKSDLSITLNKIKIFEEKVNLQRKNSFYLLEQLKKTALVLPFERQGSFCNYYLFPVLVKDKKVRDKFCEHLRMKGVDTSTLFSKTPEIARVKYGYTGDCPFTEYVSDRILTIPNHFTLKRKELDKIIESINTCSFLEA